MGFNFENRDNNKRFEIFAATVLYDKGNILFHFWERIEEKWHM